MNVCKHVLMRACVYDRMYYFIARDFFVTECAGLGAASDSRQLLDSRVHSSL